MQRVLVIDKNKQPLMPCHPARARHLLKQGKAAVFRKYPFTIILKDREGGDTQAVQVKIDPGSKTTGIAIVANFKRGLRAIWVAELTHRGQQIRDALLKRRQLRRGRRSRKTRYRKPRFLNRRRPKGWLAPSLKSRVRNIWTWLKRLNRFVPITNLAMELTRFDTQKMENPEISGIEYQQGTLQGYEVREYLLEKWGHKCAYCGAVHAPLQVEHIRPKSRGGSNRISNLTLACADCNQQKGNRTAAEFGYPNIQTQAKKPLKDAAAMNATRWALFRQMELTGLPIETGTGGQTKFNRNQQDYPKKHWLDAVCVGKSGQHVFVHLGLSPLIISASGRSSRQMCRVDKYGFPRTKAKQFKRVKGFQTGDMVKAIVANGKKTGTYVGRVAVRASGSFNIKTAQGTIQGISYKYCQPQHRSDGYAYSFVSATG
ncbi:MAG: RNA-guided endonuclease IscB [Anaerolineae bacterium]|nr:RNA-guided endonuclease IscB [Anaerolineae bacterium]MDQ7034989.1 RNA-guided endonuclease IscB [Anaerolineae bacterium]